MRPLTGAILTAARTRAAEEAIMAGGVSVEALMERAGAAVAEAVWRFGGGQETLFVCGPGNNGGDGYIAAHVLRARGLAVRVAALREPRSAAAIHARSLWRGPVEPVETATPAPVLVDSLFGTGLRDELEPEIATALSRLARAARFVLGVDLPSGVQTDTGAILGAVQCDATVALAAFKPAHLLFPAAGLCGNLLLADIGIEAASEVAVLSKPALNLPRANDHKYTRGLAGIVAGPMSGASALAAKAACRIAGYTILSGEGDAPNSVVRRSFVDMILEKRLSSLVVGPGLVPNEDGREKVVTSLDRGVSLVLDAGALNILGELGFEALDASRPTVLTPHEGEFLALFGDLPGSKIDRCVEAAARAGCVVVLKGPDTVVAGPCGRAAVGVDNPSWLASAGTGDVLAGIVGGLLARDMDPFDAACTAVWLHGKAARLAGPALIADDLPDHLPSAIATCL
jgi:ADP-dependent NAD(P)H-hydrate dehydratase / NAD(P)H-hydrate epimerase